MQTAIFIGVLLTLIGVGVCQRLILDLRRTKTETLELLKAVKEWVEQGRGMRQDVRNDAGKVARKAEQLADAVEKVPDRTADKVVERIGGNSGGDSGKLPTVKLPE